MTRLVTALNEVGRSQKAGKTRTGLCSPALGHRMEQMPFPKMRENVFGREGGTFIFGCAEMFKASSCCNLGFCTDFLFLYSQSRFAHNPLQMNKINLRTYRSSHEPAFLTTTQFVFFNIKIFLFLKMSFQAQGMQRVNCF